MQNENTVSQKLDRIDSALDRIRTKTDTSGNVIEDVASAVESLVAPEGNINITNTSSTDVTNYATAQVVDSNLTAGNIKKDTTILGITGSYEGEGTDWSEIGYSEEPQTITDGFNYAKTIYDNWDSTRTNYNARFSSDYSLRYMPLVDTSNGTTFSGMFQLCSKLENVPQLNTSNGTIFSSMFQLCSKLENVPQLNTSNGTNFANMFMQCTNLKYMPLIDTSNGTTFSGMLSYCSGLTSIPQLNTSNGTNFANMFMQSSTLQTIPQLNFEKAINVNNMLSSCSRLTTVGGFLNLGQAYLTTQSANYGNYKLDLSSCTLLTHDSLMNVINNLYDIATKGCNTQQLILGSTNLAKLTAEEIAIATNKGFSVS